MSLFCLFDDLYDISGFLSMLGISQVFRSSQESLVFHMMKINSSTFAFCSTGPKNYGKAQDKLYSQFLPKSFLEYLDYLQNISF